MFIKLVWLTALFSVLIAIYFYVFQHEISESKPSETRLFTNEELSLYDGINKPELYLAILGRVYDVTAGASHYGPGKSYNVFIGKDTSRSFITGKFTPNEASDEVTDLSNEDLRSLNHWVKFYGKQYKKVGKLVGRYYKSNGKLTKYGKDVKNLIKQAENEKDLIDLEKIKFPPCNIEWDAARGSHVWCTQRSGGIDRNWIGVPRQFYEPGSKTYRCACVQLENSMESNLKQYDGCDSESTSCYIQQ